MTRDQAHIVQMTWRTVLPVGATFAELFYGRLFALDPDVRRLFKDDLIEQVQGIITVGEFYAMAAGGQIIFT